MIYYIGAALVLSLSVNVLFVLYSRWLAEKVAESQLFVEDIWKIITDFSKHLKIVSELEMFYGDETLKSLMLHSSEIIKILEEYDSLLVEDPDPEEVESLEGPDATES